MEEEIAFENGRISELVPWLGYGIGVVGKRRTTHSTSRVANISSLGISFPNFPSINVTLTLTVTLILILLTLILLVVFGASGRVYVQPQFAMLLCFSLSLAQFKRLLKTLLSV